MGFGGQFGYYNDAETGLILCTQRYYDPSASRWLTRDPSGYGGYDGGVDVYAYGDSNPVNASDPSGQDGTKDNRSGWQKFWDFVFHIDPN